MFSISLPFKKTHSLFKLFLLKCLRLPQLYVFLSFFVPHSPHLIIYEIRRTAPTIILVHKLNEILHDICLEQRLTH